MSNTLNAPIELPDQVELLPLIGSAPTSIEQIVIGQAVSGNQLETVTIPLTKMGHTGIAGATAWGKSVFLSSLALQTALAKEDVQMAFIDPIECAIFTPFQKLERLRYPIAYNEGDVIDILKDLQVEMKRRIELFASHRVQNLTDYNALGDVDPLSYIIVFFDNASLILENNAYIRTLLAANLAQLRKTGVLFFLTGVDRLPGRSAIRYQLNSYITFRVNNHWQAPWLSKETRKKAAALKTKGRAWAILPGRQEVQLQTPYLQLQTRYTPNAATFEEVLAQIN